MLQDFLVYVGGVGAVAAVSWLFEYFGWFQSLQAKTKQLVFFAACVVVGVGAYSVNTYVPAEILEQIAPFFQIVGSIFAYLFLGSKFHEGTKVEDAVG